MYLPYPARRMRDNLLDDEVAALRIESADDDARIALESRAESLGGSLEREFQLGGIVVLLAEPAASDLCEFNGAERIETVDTLGY